jgi:hypothetical protein
MPNKRRSIINRAAKTTISPAAVEAYRDMEAAPKASDQWWEAHNALHRALDTRPWFWPVQERDDWPEIEAALMAAVDNA